MKRIAVIGGGITGLAACYRLLVEAQRRGLSLQVTLCEASNRVGGVIQTASHHDLLMEYGPDAFLSTKPWAKALCEELGIADQLIGTNSAERRSFIVRHNTLYPVPEGFYLMAPSSFWPFITTPIFSWRGKLRMACELFIPRRQTTDDESLAHFVTRRLGREALLWMAQPMVAGIYTADPHYLSLQATMPQFLEMERRYGSVIRGLLAQKKTAKQRAQNTNGTSGARYSLFLSFISGMQTLIEALVKFLPADCIRLGSKILRLSRIEQQGIWCLHDAKHQEIRADAVCLALPAHQGAPLLQPFSPDLARLLADIPYASSATINMVFPRKHVSHPLNGMGFVVPFQEGRSLLACSFSSVKFAGRAPNDQVLLRAFVGGALQEDLLQYPDQTLIAVVLKDLYELLGITAEPTHVVVSKHFKAMAQYHVGHLEKVTHIESLIAKLPGLALAGNAYRGIGIPDCIHSAEQAAHKLLDFLF